MQQHAAIQNNNGTFLAFFENYPKSKKFIFDDYANVTHVLTKKYNLVKLYGKQKDLHALRIQFHIDFPPTSGICESAGWLSPRGKFFPCNFAEHARTARRLAYIYYSSDKGDDILEKRGWLHVSDLATVTDVRGKITQSQLDSLMDIYSVSENTHFKESIMRFINSNN